MCASGYPWDSVAAWWDDFPSRCCKVGFSGIQFSAWNQPRRSSAGKYKAEEVQGGMFLGDHQHTLDSKGRVSLPARFRIAMTGKLVVAKGLDKCLYVYPADEYVRFVSDLIAKEDFEPRVRKVRRFFTAGAVEVELDSAGRIGLPANLRAWAGLSKDVAVTGNGNRIELWDSEVWSQYSEGGENIEDLAQELADAGLL